MTIEIIYQGFVIQEITLPYHFKIGDIQTAIRAKSKMKGRDKQPALPKVHRSVLTPSKGGRPRSDGQIDVPALLRENNPNWRGGKKKTMAF